MTPTIVEKNQSMVVGVPNLLEVLHTTCAANNIEYEFWYDNATRVDANSLLFIINGSDEILLQLNPRVH
jgi:nicotinate-nucleotide pyrophosphorylase